MAAAISLALTVVACEVVLRIYVAARGWTPNCYASELDFFVPHPVAGYTVKDNFHLKSGVFSVRTNSRGMRGPEPRSGKEPGVTRIAILGESSAFGYLVNDGEEAARLLENLLWSTGYKVEVINAAVPGYNLYQTKTRFEADVATLRPDVVLLYLGWNDLAYVVSDEPLAQRFRTRQVAAWWKRALGKSTLYGFVMYRMLGGPAGMMQADFGGHQPTHVGEEQFRRNLRALVSDVRRYSPRVVIGIQATAAHPDVSTAMRRSLAHTPEKEQATIHLGQWLHDTELALADELGLPVIDAYGQIPPDEAHFGDYVHLTKVGERLLAEIWAEGLTPQLPSRPD